MWHAFCRHSRQSEQNDQHVEAKEYIMHECNDQLFGHWYLTDCRRRC